MVARTHPSPDSPVTSPRSVAAWKGVPHLILTRVIAAGYCTSAVWATLRGTVVPARNGEGPKIPWSLG